MVRNLIVLLCCLPVVFCYAQNKGKRTVDVVEDRNQTFFTTKTYYLKHVDPENLVPFLQGAVRRNNREGSVLPFYSEKGKGIVVNMATDTVKDVDAIVQKLDRPAKGNGKNAIVGDGITRFTYKPKYGVSGRTIRRLSHILRDDGGTMYYDKSKNLVYGKGSKSYAEQAVELISGIDQPVENGGTAAKATTGSRVTTGVNVNVDEKTDSLHLINTTNDPKVITKTYLLKHADPYEIRPILKAMVGAKRVNTSRTGVECIRYKDGTGGVIVSAEDYRFRSGKYGKGIDDIIKDLDQPEATANDGDDVMVYTPGYSNARKNARFIRQMGFDPPRTPGEGVVVDNQLNAVVVKSAPFRQKAINGPYLVGSAVQEKVAKQSSVGSKNAVKVSVSLGKVVLFISCKSWQQEKNTPDGK